MKTTRFSTLVLWVGFVTCFFALSGLTGAEEPARIIHELDFNECDPVMIQGAVMSVNPKNRTITVAEKEIRLMDVGSDDQRIKTALINSDGKPEKMESFKIRQLVRIEGYEHPEGFIAASKIQKINAIQEVRKESRGGFQPAKAKR
jgi:hypothetical protein